MLTDGRNTYTWNSEDQLKTAAGVTYTYDGDGHRVEKSSGKLYWYGTGSDPLMETDLSGNLTDEYIFFGGKRIARRDSSNNVVYYAADHLGTSRVVASSAGAILDQSDFYPFGGERVLSTSSGNTYKFTAKERDSESNLDNFGARYDSSILGRFMSPDSKMVWQKVLANPQDLNLYSYTINNPLRYSDPDGRDWKEALGELLNSIHIKVSFGFGVANTKKVLGTGFKGSAETKVTMDVNKHDGIKFSKDAGASLKAEAGGKEVGPEIGVSKNIGGLDASGKPTGAEPAQPYASWAGGSTAASSGGSNNGEVSVLATEDNIVVPVDGVPVPTPFTFGLELTVDFSNLWKAGSALFEDGENKQPPSPLVPSQHESLK